VFRGRSAPVSLSTALQALALTPQPHMASPYIAYPGFAGCRPAVPPPTSKSSSPAFNVIANSPPSTRLEDGTRVEASKTQASKDYLAAVQRDRAPLDLTLGCEFEFILAVSTSPTESGGMGNVSSCYTGRQLILDALRQPLPATCSTCGTPHGFMLALPRDMHTSGYETWAVESDCTIRLTEDEGDALGGDKDYVETYSVELKTRVMSANRDLLTTRDRGPPAHTHSISWAEEVRAVLSHLNKTFNAPDDDFPRYRLMTNTTCGNHVHVGNGHHGFPLQTIKNLMSAYAACEPAIDLLQTTDRIGASGAATMKRDKPWIGPKHGPFSSEDSEAYNSSLSALHSHGVYAHCRARNRQHAQDPGSYPANAFATDDAVRAAAFQYSLPAAVAIVQHAPDLSALQGLTAGYSHSCTFNLENLRDMGEAAAARYAKMTVEFRQHAATLDPEEVLPWMDFLLRLTLHAHATAVNADTGDLIGKFLRPDFGAIDLLTMIGCSSSTLAHYARKLGGAASLSQILVMQAAGLKADDSYAQQQHREALIHLETLAPNHPSKNLLRQNINDRFAGTSRPNIGKRLLQKFLAGGYGQFPDSVLDGVDFHFPGFTPTDAQAQAARARLRVGWVHPEAHPPSGSDAPVLQPRTYGDFVPDTRASTQWIPDTRATERWIPDDGTVAEPGETGWRPSPYASLPEDAYVSRFTGLRVPGVGPAIDSPGRGVWGGENPDPVMLQLRAMMTSPDSEPDEPAEPAAPAHLPARPRGTGMAEAQGRQGVEDWFRDSLPDYNGLPPYDGAPGGTVE
ncbi:hypothetical protein LTR53_016483, partial [Teratosphaeriaceae sp. CCFEE 6253]